MHFSSKRAMFALLGSLIGSLLCSGCQVPSGSSDCTSCELSAACAFPGETFPGDVTPYGPQSQPTMPPYGAPLPPADDGPSLQPIPQQVPPQPAEPTSALQYPKHVNLQSGQYQENPQPGVSVVESYEAQSNGGDWRVMPTPGGEPEPLRVWSGVSHRTRKVIDEAVRRLKPPFLSSRNSVGYNPAGGSTFIGEGMPQSAWPMPTATVTSQTITYYGSPYAPNGTGTAQYAPSPAAIAPQPSSVHPTAFGQPTGGPPIGHTPPAMPSQAFMWPNGIVGMSAKMTDERTDW